MSAVLLEIIILFLLIVLNGLFALAEIAIVSSRKIKLQQLAEEGSRGAKIALGLAQKPADFIATVQLGITLIGILAGAFGGATLADNLAQVLLLAPILDQYAVPLAFGIIVVLITVFSLILGELLPKQIALSNPEKFAIWFSRPVLFLTKVLSFFVRLLNGCTLFLFRFLHIQPRAESLLSAEEIKLIIRRGFEEGILEEVEEDILQKVLRFDIWTVNSLMIARNEVVWLDINSTPADNWEKIVNSGYFYFPVCDESVDKVVGVVSLREVLKQESHELLPLKELMNEVMVVPGNTSVLNLIKRFKSSGNHVAVIVDEHGGMDGFITMGNILEGLLGVVPTADAESHEPEMIERSDGSWLIDAGLHIDQLKELLGTQELPSEELARFETLRGFIMSYLGHIPRTGERFEFEGHKFEIMDMDGHRIDKVLLYLSPKVEEEVQGE